MQHRNHKGALRHDQAIVPTVSVTDADLRKLLLDPLCPFARVLRGGDGKLILIEDLLRFSRGRVSNVDDLEQRMDAMIAGIGGSRTGMIDPWSAPARFVRRLAGKANPCQDMFEIPAAFFESELAVEAGAQTPPPCSADAPT